MKLTTTWDLSKLGKNVNDPAFIKGRKKTERAYKAFAKKWKANRKFTITPSILREALDEYEKLVQIGGKESRYLFLAGALDTQDPKIQAASTLYRDFGNKISNYIRFFELKIGKIPQDKQARFLDSVKLKPYRNYLKGIFDSARYFLSEKEEKILSMKGAVSSGNWVAMLDEFLSSETRKVLVQNSKTKKLVTKEQNFSELMNLVRDKNKKVSKTAIAAVKDILNKHSRVAEKEINSFLENKKINDELRGFERPDSARHNAEDIDTKAVDTLVKTVTENFKVSRDYYTFKAKLFKKKNFSYWERIVEYGSIGTRYPYNKAVTLVEKALRRISDEFADMFMSFATNGQIDVYPKKGKTSGAFCMPGYTQDVNLMLNHNESLRNVATLAHEMGHGIQEMKARTENALNYGHPMCTAEVSSTFCEDFVIDELFDQSNDKERLVIMVGQLEDKIATIFRQVAAYNFETELHKEFREKGYLTEKQIGEMFNKHMKSYMGNAVTFDKDSGRGWIYWGHFRSPFYVYSYSMALLVAQSARKRFSKRSCLY